MLNLKTSFNFYFLNRLTNTVYRTRYTQAYISLLPLLCFIMTYKEPFLYVQNIYTYIYVGGKSHLETASVLIAPYFTVPPPPQLTVDRQKSTLWYAISFLTNDCLFSLLLLLRLPRASFWSWMNLYPLTEDVKLPPVSSSETMSSTLSSHKEISRIETTGNDVLLLNTLFEK
jgi:hypothetical protein